MAETLHDTSYLNTGLDSIKAANDSGLKNLSLTNANYNSTTHIPSSEPRLIEQLLKAANELYNKLDKDLADIRKVGEGFATMDNFLEGQSIDLGFQVESAKVNITNLSNYAATSLEHLLEKEVPIIEGYNDIFGNENNNNGGNTGNNNGNSGNYSNTGNNGTNGNSGGNNTTTTGQNEKTTETKFENKTEGSTEILSEPTSETNPEEATESSTEMLSEPTSETEVSTVVATEVPTTVVEKETKPSGGTNKKPNKGNTNKKPKNSNVNTKPTEPIIVDTQEEIPTEAPKQDQIVIEEPYVEPEQEITIDETPDIINLDQNIQTEEPVKKNNTGRVVAGVIAGLGLAGGAAAGYGVYKKKKEDKEYEDYGYEEDGGDN